MPKTHIPTPKTKGDRGELFPPDRGSRGAVAPVPPEAFYRSK